MNKEEGLKLLVDSGVVAIIRVKKADEAVKVAEAIKKGGVKVIEVSMNTPNALDAIRRISQKFGGEVLVGAGTVLDPETARATILAGADLIIGPALNKEVIEVCRRYGKICVPGAFTPTEILTAWEAGADLVKVFPAAPVPGPGYLKAVKAPLPQIMLVPVGGVNLANAADFIRAGAAAVAAGGSIVDKKAVAEGRFEVVTEKARKFMEAVKKARKAT